MSNKLIYNKFKVSLKASKDCELPNYHGSMIRGVIGKTIREVSCTKENEICEQCEEKVICPYTKIFYGINIDKETMLKGIDNVPNSFIIEPLMNGITYLKKDEILEFNLTVLGSSIDYLQYYFYAIYKIANRGLSKGNIKFVVDKITDQNNNTIADNNLIYFDKIKPLIYEADIANLPMHDISVYFETPARIKESGRFVQNISFELLIKSLLRRTTLIFDFYGEKKLDIDYKFFIDKAKNISCYETNTAWMNLERYSSRTNKHLSIGGMVGKISYKGDLSDFYPILELGKILHVGKGCVMGLGKFTFTINNL